MRLRRLVLWALTGAVSACAMPPTHVLTEVYREPESVQFAVDAEQNAEPFTSVQSMLAYRSGVCALPEQQQASLLQEFRVERSDRATLGILMLASCSPDQTPGLLANHLVKAGAIEHAPPGLHELLALMGAQLRSYALVERRLRDTEHRLERMITGLREIEAQMGGGDH